MSCSEGQLACANEQQCINRELWCDGAADCDDESDEQGWWVLCICMLYNIRIYHECEGRIEKSVPRITVWHHEACRVNTNGDPRAGFFHPSLACIMDSFSCSSLFLFIYLFIYLLFFCAHESDEQGWWVLIYFCT